MKTRHSLRRFFCAITLIALPLTASAAPAANRPNFLVILTDDVGWGDYQCYNPAGKIPSPNVDRLAREGMRFTHAHTPAALCAPTRYSMLTGNYPWRGRGPHGTWGFNVPSQMLPGQKTIANLLQAAGYRTAMFGKSGTGGEHVTRDGRPDFTQPMIDGPRRWGFDTSFIIPRGHQTDPLIFLEDERPSCGAENVVRGPGQFAYSEPGWKHEEVGARLLARAEKFLDDVIAKNRASGEPAPFFMHFCADGAHAPYEPPETLGGVPVRGRTGMTAHTDMVWQTDVLLGRLTALLAARGLLANTLICLTSDNGGIPTDRDLGHDAVGGLYGSKSEIWEGGHRVPFLVRWGDGTARGSRIPPGTVRSQPVGAHDIVATMAELAGVASAPDQMLDSVSLAPVLLGRQDDDHPVRSSLLVQSCPSRDAFSEGTWHPEAKRLPPLVAPIGPAVASSDHMAHALYAGEWKLVLNMSDQPAALYNLDLDLRERTNRIADPAHAGRVKAMEETYRAIRASGRSVEISRAGGASR